MSPQAVIYLEPCPLCSGLCVGHRKDVAVLGTKNMDEIVELKFKEPATQE